MFEGFVEQRIDVGAATLNVRHGGVGPPILLLHGHPRTHATWCRVAPILAAEFTVVCPDLRGFGKSTIPEDSPDHFASSKRQKAQDCLQLMRRLGFERFAVAGHNRGSYAAFRLAMDFPSSISRLAVLDGIPIIEALERCTDKFAKAWWHWFFYAQPAKPEREINADPDAWYQESAETMGEEAYRDFHSAIHNPSVVHGMVEDYRAGLSIDHLHDAEDRATGRKLQCSTLVLWSERDDLEYLYGDVLEVWRPWAASVLHGKSLPCGHHMAEEIPDQLAAELGEFFK